MEGSCGQFRSNKIVNFNDVYWRQNYENRGGNDQAKVFRPYRRGYHGGGDILFSPPRTVGWSRYRPYGTSPNHHYTPISNNIHQPIQVQSPTYGRQAAPYYPPAESYYQRRDRYVQTGHVHQNTFKFNNTATCRRLDLGHVTDLSQHENTSVNYPPPKLESYQTRDSRIRAGVKRGYPAVQKFSNISNKQSTDVLSVAQAEVKDQGAWPETNSKKKQDASSDNLRKLGIKRPRPVSTSPTYNPVRKQTTHNPIMSKYMKEKHSSKPVIISSLDEVVIPEISQYDLKPEYTEEGESIYLGQGGYGYVVKAKLLQDDGDQKTDVAAKYFIPKLNNKKTVLTEARIQKYLEDTGAVPKVHGLVDLPHKDDLPVLVQECVCEGNTAEDMMAKGGSKLTWLKFCCEAAKGLQKIHQKHVLLNDIKYDNILIDNKDNSMTVKFVDFGLASFKSSFVSSKPESEMAECYHIAPEVKKQGPSTILSDIFSLGYVISHIGKKTKHSFIETLGKLLTASDPSLRFSLSGFITFVEGVVINEEIKAGIRVNNNL